MCLSQHPKYAPKPHGLPSELSPWVYCPSAIAILTAVLQDDGFAIMINDDWSLNTTLYHESSRQNCIRSIYFTSSNTPIRRNAAHQSGHYANRRCKTVGTKLKEQDTQILEKLLGLTFAACDVYMICNSLRSCYLAASLLLLCAWRLWQHSAGIVCKCQELSTQGIIGQAIQQFSQLPKMQQRMIAAPDL